MKVRRGRGRTSGLELEQRSVANLFHLRRGRVTRIIVYLDRELAFANIKKAAEHFDVEMTEDNWRELGKQPQRHKAARH